MDVETKSAVVSSECVECMLERVAHSDAHFKHQQRSDPDLTLEQKKSIAQNIFEKTPAKFLYQFGKFLELDDLENFSKLETDYEISCYTKDIRSRLGNKSNVKTVRNRRFNALKKLSDEGKFYRFFL